MDGLDDLDTRLLVDLLRDHRDPRKSLGQHYLVDDQVRQDDGNPRRVLRATI